MTGYSFQTRARTIDHLGRGQIADSPTAISELWKNAYDAYARSVSLHIFSGERPLAAIFDDGKGMSVDDLRKKWLVLGTESKTEDDPDDHTFRKAVGLPERVKQGEKGIGRLSVAFLAPATALITKKTDGKFAVVLVDWRLFENPYLALADIRLPVREFDEPAQIIPGISEMMKVVLENLGSDSIPDVEGSEEADEATRQRLLKAAWERFASQEAGNRPQTTRDSIVETWATNPVSDRVLGEWEVYLELCQHGTALIMIDVKSDLSVWVEPTVDERADELVKDRLKKTLTAFTDPFAVPDPGSDDPRLHFSYEVLVQSGENPRRILATDDIFGPDDFHALEHYVDGHFDEFGVFEGEVVAFGKSYGRQQVLPERSLTKSDRRQIGCFSFSVATFEQELRNTTHNETFFQNAWDAASKYAGVFLYRDGLRVMPYGRPDADFFGLEERRTNHAGRHYWSHRRTFGRIAFTRAENPKLLDKAGREGLVDNRAKALLRMLVINVLRETAKRFFGTDSSVRQEEIPRLQAQHQARQKSAKTYQKRRQVSVNSFLENKSKPIRAALVKVAQTAESIRVALATDDRGSVTTAANEYRSCLALRESLRPPPMPSGAPMLEDDYRSYRDQYQELLAGLEELGGLTAKAEAAVGRESPEEAVRTAFHRNQSLISARIESYVKALSNQSTKLREQNDERASEDRKRYWQAASGFLDQEIEPDQLVDALNSLDAIRNGIDDDISDRYEPLLRSLELVLDGVDLEGAATFLSDDISQLEEKVRDLHAVAQVGISVEIIGHELESLDAEVRRNLARLPSEVKASAPYRLAYDAHSALTEKLRFLSPLKIAGYRNREEIRGSDIADYIEDFFERTFTGNRITFNATEAFRSIIFTDLRSRIFPVFINLINNSIFWVTRVEKRLITIDFIGGKVVVSDTGPGVDPDDLDRLFTIFYTRRMGGRGVGLYLCRVNLGVANHQIRYAGEGDPKIHDGANFIIVFKGVMTK